MNMSVQSLFDNATSAKNMMSRIRVLLSVTMGSCHATENS